MRSFVRARTFVVGVSVLRARTKQNDALRKCFCCIWGIKTVDLYLLHFDFKKCNKIRVGLIIIILFLVHLMSLSSVRLIYAKDVLFIDSHMLITFNYKVWHKKHKHVKPYDTSKFRSSVFFLLRR